MRWFADLPYIATIDLSRLYADVGSSKAAGRTPP